MPSDESRLARAMRILRIDADATAETLADALWLARVLPPSAPRVTPPPPPPPPNGGNGGQQQRKQTSAARESKAGGGGTAPAQDAKARLYAPGGAAADTAGIPATFITVPSADALPRRLELERALKPFLKRLPSRRLKELDDDATAEASADRRSIMPVFRPVPERWFDVLLLVEQTDAMEVWADTVRELQALLARHGAFRSARVLRYAVRGESVALSTVSGQPVSAFAAADPQGRRLCLFLTNGASLEWRRRPLADFVRRLGRTTVVAIVPMLPPRSWSRTALGDALERLRSPLPGAPNAALEIEDPLTGLAERALDASYVPAFSLDPKSVERWARFVMSPRRVISPAVRLENGAFGAAGARRERPPEERVAAFREAASRESFQLLRLLAGAPLTAPVMRLVQQSADVSNEPFHLAEIMLSGLVERVTPAGSGLPPDQVFYDFVPGVREYLLGTLSSGEADTLDGALRPVEERLRRFVEARTGRAVRDFRALLADPAGMERLPASARHFLEISRRIYEERGILPRGVAPPGEARQEVEIRPRLLLAGRVIGDAVITGDGAHVVALTHGGNGTEVTVWDRLGNVEPGFSLPRDPRAMLLAASRRDIVFVVAGGALVRVTGRTGAGMAVGRSVQGRLMAIDPDGKVLDARTDGIWRLDPADDSHPERVRPFFRDMPVALAAGGGAVITGFRDGSVWWDVEDSVSIRNASGTPIRALALSADGAALLGLEESGAVFHLTTGPKTFEFALPVEYATCIAISPDGSLGVIGHHTGRVTVWDFIRFTKIAELTHGKAQITAVSVSASGHAVSASRDGLNLWDLSAVKSTLFRRAAKTPRRVRVLSEPGAEGLGGQLAAALVKAGHFFAPDDVSHEYSVLAANPSTPVAPDILPIRGMDEFPALLDELDRNPPGRVMLPPVLQNPVARPELEQELERFVVEIAKSGSAYVRGAILSGWSVTLQRVLLGREVRRAFPGGVYWDIAPTADPVTGRKLVVIVQDVSPSSLPEGCATLRFVPETQYVDGPVFEIPLLSEEDAAAHLRAAGMAEDRIKASIAFHRLIPALVSVAAGAARHAIPIPAQSDDNPETAFRRVAAPALQAMNALDRAALIEVGAWFDDDTSLFVTDDALLGFAIDFGWVRAREHERRLTFWIRELLAQTYPKETASAHERICDAMERDIEHGAAPPRTLLQHAYLAGGAERVERVLRRRKVLEALLAAYGRDLADRVRPHAKGSRFLERFCSRVARGDVSDIPALLAPPRPWREIEKAHAAGIRGKGIRVAVPATGCNPLHPEFGALRDFPGIPREWQDYGTQVCSVIAGQYIGVAPEALLLPMNVLDAGLATSGKHLAEALAPLLESPPEILCVTLGLPPEEASPLQDIIMKLIESDVLVVAAAGNLGPDKVFAPAVFPGVLAVGAVDFKGRVAEFSGPGPVYGYGVDVPVATGDSNYTTASGTTFAAAYVAGIAALCASAMGLRGRELRQMLIDTVGPQTRIARFVPPMA